MNENQALTDWSDDDDFLGQEMEEVFSLLPHESDKQSVYLDALKSILPHLGANEVKIVVTEIMIALKIEGLIGKQMTSRDTKMVHTLKDAILSEPIRRRQALSLAQQLLSDPNSGEAE